MQLDGKITETNKEQKLESAKSSDLNDLSKEKIHGMEWIHNVRNNYYFNEENFYVGIVNIRVVFAHGL